MPTAVKDLSRVSYGPVGFNPDEGGTTTTVNDPLYTITDFDEVTAYHVYVRTVCDAGAYSEWAGPLQINEVPGDDCYNALNLTAMSAPYEGSMAYTTVDFNNCYDNVKRDMVFTFDLEPGQSIKIWLEDAGFNATYAALVGEDCEGQMFSCGNNPESSPVAWYNNSDEPQVVSYVLGDIGGEGDDFTLNWEYGTEPICVFNLEFEQFSTDGQDFIRIKWGFTGNVHPDKVVYGPAGFDPATGGTVMQLNQSLNSCSIYDLVKGQLYDIYIFSPCVDAKPVKRSVMLPCEPQVSILNVQPYDIIDLSDGGGNVEIAYNDNCNNLFYLIFMDENSSDYYLSTSYQLEGVEGIQTLKIDPSLPSGKYIMALAVAGLRSNGYPDMKYLYSQSVYVVNNTKSIKFSYPSFDEVYQYQEGINNYVDFSWLTSNVGFVNVEYSINGGLTWESVSYKQSTGRGVPTEDYNEARLKVPESWVGKELMLRVSSTFDSSVFAVSPTVTILPEQSPFTLISPTEELVIWMGEDIIIEFGMTYAEAIAYSVVSYSGIELFSGTFDADEGFNTLEINTSSIEPGSGYSVIIYGAIAGWRADVGNITVEPDPTSVEEHPAIIADVRIWPVPAKDVLYVRSSVANDIRIAELYDLTGRKLDQTIVNGQAFTISKLASGVYVVVVEGKSYKVVKK